MSDASAMQTAAAPATEQSAAATAKPRMIARKLVCGDASDSWQDGLRDMLTSYGELADFLQGDFVPFNGLGELERNFPLRVTRDFARRIQLGDPDDPLLKQILPDVRELRHSSATTADPLNESAFVDSPGIIRKYRHRALLILTGACAIHCRYCFRRNFDYAEHSQSRARWRTTISELAADDSLHEVILSGGDPLMLDDAALGEHLREIAAIPHVRRIRLHTRLVSVLPSRVTPALVELLGSLSKPVVVVSHINHANEVDDAVIRASRLLRSVAHMLNQAVLLRGVNVSLDVQTALSERLLDADILPYYLHLPDAVNGAEHFMVSQAEAAELHGRMLAALPGYLVPRLVREDPGFISKVPVVSNETMILRKLC